MPDYSAQAARVAAQIEKYGAAATLTRAKAGDYDPASGDVDDNGTSVFNTKAVRSEFKKSDVDGTQIRAGDVLLLVSPTLATTPEPGDFITFDGERFNVVNSVPVKPATVVVLHQVQCRA